MLSRRGLLARFGIGAAAAAVAPALPKGEYVRYDEYAGPTMAGEDFTNMVRETLRQRGPSLLRNIEENNALIARLQAKVS